MLITIPKIKNLVQIGFNRFTSQFSAVMSEALDKRQSVEKTKSTYKSRYNGKYKKRQWVDYDNSDSTSEEKRNRIDPGERIKRKKSVILLGYSGKDYYGMQRNPEMKTIEEDLLVAMLKHQWISEDGFKSPQTAGFQRAARTDKGVSAARQIVSVKLPDNVDINALNTNLPAQIKVFAVKRVTKGFNAKDQCNARTYIYTLPTISFADYNDLVAEQETYRVSEEKIKRVNEILKMFEGTKNFHNFTSKKEYLDPSAKRFIMSIECGSPFLSKNVEFAVIKVKGQSFMLHQIRKMIGLTLAIIRGLTNDKTLEKAFTEIRLDIPMAPGLGLVLDQVHYDRYNQRYGDDGVHSVLNWDEYEPMIKEFIDQFIFPTIVDTELEEKSMVGWLETLPLHSFDVRIDSKTKETDIKNDDDGDMDE